MNTCVDRTYRHDSIVSSSSSKLVRSAIASLVLNIVIMLAQMTTPPENALDLYKDCFAVAQVYITTHLYIMTEGTFEFSYV